MKFYRSTLNACLLFLNLVLISPVLLAEVDFSGSLVEGKYNRYIPAISNPLFNETPLMTTEVRPILLLNKIPDDFVTGGGNIKIVAAEIRVALNDRWGIIATKDGYADIDFEGVLPDESGAVNVSLGIKYAAYFNRQTHSIVTLGLEYEPPVGALESGGIDLQGQGDGFLDLFVSGATFKGRWGWQGNIGYNKALDSDHDSSMLHVSGHVNYQVNQFFYPVLELNVFSVVQDGDRFPFDFEGIDLVNFGSTNAGTVTTMAIGARFIITDHVRLGLAFEAPVGSNEDIMDKRLYVDMVLSL
ncbi:MAG: hypothetical protein KUG79_13590 [Pseudomonadales bacterium]|nr:hypothetical protein [Pseudomonadales bacterium]